jgi:beta-glucanase (GH16 family)
MKKLLFLVCLMASQAFSQTLTVSNISASEISHSSMLLHFDVSASWQNVRVRFIKQSLGTCSAGTGGVVHESGYPGNSSYRPTTQFRIILSGLTANTAYYVCPEVSANGDSLGNGTWSTGAQFGVTTLPLPTVHPALPIDPTDYNPAYPDTTGYTQINFNASCVNAADGSSFQTVMDNAIANQLNNGTVINIPGGALCDRMYQPNNDSPGLRTFPTSGISSVDSSITITGSGYTEGQGLIFTHGYAGGFPGAGNPDPTADDPKLCTGVIGGYVYYAHLPAAGTPDKFQLTCNAPFGQPGAVLMQFPANNLGWGNIKVQTYPINRKWVIVRTANTGINWLPDGVRVTPIWAPKMPKFSMRLNQASIGGGYEVPACSGVALIRFSACDGNEGRMVSNVWFKGVEITHVKSVDGATSTDPVPFHYLLDISRTNQDIVFDQVYLHGQGAPDRLFRPIASWNGHNVAFLNSYFTDMDIYQSNYTGLNVTGSTNTVSVAAGVHGLNGAAKYTQAGTVTFTTTGSTSGTAMIFASLDGSKLNMQLPPGLTGTCSGGACQVFTADNSPGNGVINTSGSVGFPNASNSGNSFAVDPIFSASSSCTSPQTIFDQNSLYNVGGAVNYELGTKFQSTASGYICGIRFNKPAADTTTSHSVALWNSAGSLVASGTSSNEAASGWISVTFGSPVAYTANAVMTASYHTSGAFWYNTNLLQNRAYSTGTNTVFALASYAASNGNCNVDDNFAQNAFGNTAVGIVGCVTFTSGSVSTVRQGDSRHSKYVDNLNGCNCFIGGQGPGPWSFKGNYVSATGNVLHHDEGGYNGADASRSGHWMRGDYNYYRDTFDVPIAHMAAQQTNSGDYQIAYDPALLAVSSTSPSGNYLYYQHRQSLEFKAGQRAKINGVVFQGGFANTASSIAVAFTSVEGNGITDVQILNSTFRHGPGGAVFSSTEGGNQQTPPIARILMRNNVFFDFRPGYFAPGGPVNPGNGWLLEGIGHEDFVLDHNTSFYNLGRANATFWFFDQKTEGVQITNNILFQGGGAGQGGIYQEFDSNNSGPNSCAGLSGPLALAACAWPNYTFTGNLLLSDQTSTQMNTWYGAAAGNYIPGINGVPGTPSTFTGIKWQNITGLTTTNAAPTVTPDFHLRNDSSYISGGTYKGTDGKDVGADLVALEQAQGRVYLNGASTVTSSSAVITFVAPDALPCAVDYSTTDPTLTSNLSRVTPPGAIGPNAVTLTGLSAATVYYYRVDCQVHQPTGQFRTAATGVAIPTASVTAPVAGTTLSGTAVSFTATASTPSGTISNVQFKLDGSNVGSPVTVAPYTLSVNTVSLTNGGHTISALATNSLGQQATSTSVGVTVSNFPSVSVTVPASGATLAGASSTLTATATAPSGRTVSSVQFKVDGVNVGALDTVSPYTSTFDTTTWSNSTHSITAVVTDSASVAVTSTPVSVTISNTQIVSAPTISPAGGTYTETQYVSLSGTGKLYYTLDGSTPTTSSTLYTSAFTVSGSKTVKAIAVASGTSSVSSAAYTTPDQIAQIAADMFSSTNLTSDGSRYATLYDVPNEAAPHGWPYGQASSFQDMNNTAVRSASAAIEFWGTTYVQSTVTNGVSPAPNTRVNIGSCKGAWFQTSTKAWHVQTFLASDISAGLYAEDFSGAEAASDIRTEADGTVSMTAGAASNGATSYTNHWFTPWPRIDIVNNDVGGVIMQCQMRLILNNSGGTDDRALAKYVVNIGGDYYPTATGPGIANNPGIAGSRFKVVTNNWRTISMTTMTDAQMRVNPPPFVTDYTAPSGGGGGTLATPALASGAGFNNLTFNDEFDTLDLAANGNGTNHKWYPGVYFAGPAPAGNMTVSNGVLNLRWTPGQTGGAGFSYNDTTVDTSIMSHNQTNTGTSATNGTVFKYGYYEVRMKADVGSNMWPAIWFDGQFGQSGNYAELDVVEIVNADGGIHAYGTIHNWPVDSPKDGANLLPVPAGTDFSQFHTYGFLWTSTQLKWYFDGQLVRTATPPASANTGPAQYLLLSQQVGSNWSEAPAPQAYNAYFDYVRVWQ